MNTRIQVEHPVTEMRSGFDLVAAQLRIAQGENIAEMNQSVEQTGHAMEFRINAENWRNDFRPSPGLIKAWRIPRGEGIRIDTAICAGLSVSPYYDSMIAKLIVHGRDRAHVLERARAALATFQCDGIDTTIDFHRMVIDQPAFIKNRIHTRWLEMEMLGDPE
jgi:acetyl-CoA carboxylase, biotin carboxylase subunit